jgi:predicted aspartyl protease
VKCDVPFRLVGGAQPLAVVPVMLNGAGPFDFALDTGATAPVIAPQLARRLGLEIDETKHATGAGGRIKIDLARVAVCQLGEASRRDVSIMISTEIERIAATVGSTLDGVIGYEFLRHFRLTLDYSRLSLSLEAGPPTPAQDRIVSLAELPIKLAHPAKPLILVPTKVNGTGPHPFALDTGASITVIADDLARRLGIRTEAIPAMTGGGGAISTSAGTLRSLSIESAEVRDLPVAVAGFFGALGQTIGTELSGILGFNYLRAFRVTIDYPAGTLRLA